MSHRARPVLALIVALVITAATAGQATALLSYPFLDGGPLRAPQVFYLAYQLPAQGNSFGMSLGPAGNGLAFETHYSLASGGELVIWENTRADATVEEAVGAYGRGIDVVGSIATWHGGVRQDREEPLLWARLGQTLVVITGPLSTEELLRIADSLHPGSPYSTML